MSAIKCSLPTTTTEMPRSWAYPRTKLYILKLSVFSMMSPRPSKLCHYTSTGMHGFVCHCRRICQLFELSIDYQFAGGCFRGQALVPLVSCPSLRPLVITGFRRTVDPLEVLESIKRFSPSLTHLCVWPFTPKHDTDAR